MRIADVTVTNLHFEYPGRAGFRYAGGVATGRLTSLVHVVAEDGTEGLGSVYSHPGLVRTIVEGQFRPWLLGQDPGDVEGLWQRMYGLTRWYGRKGAALSALGGVDMALWDLRGKAAGLPLYRLLGGERAHVPAYASALLWQDDVGALEREAREHRERGFRRMKMRLGRNRDYDVEAIEAVKRGAGADGDVMADGSHRYTVEGAERLGRVLAAHKVFWFEEPFAPEDLDAYVALRPRLSVPLAAGENEFGVQGFRELLRAGAVDIVQPDACRAGGISESLRIAKLAAAFGARVAPHTWSDAVALLANAHIAASVPHGVTVEVDRTGNPFIDELLAEPLRIHDGLLHLPDAPGLGAILDRAAVSRYTLPPDASIPDGSYSDMAFGANCIADAPPYGPPV